MTEEQELYEAERRLLKGVWTATKLVIAFGLLCWVAYLAGLEMMR